MSTIKNVIVSTSMTLIAGAASVIGILAGFAIWNNGLGGKIEKKTKQLFEQHD